MKKPFALLLAALPLLLHGATVLLDDFSYPEAQLARRWHGFGGDNPAPAPSLADGKLTLATTGGPGDKVIVTAIDAPPGDSIDFEIAADAGNAPDSYGYIAIRRTPDAANLALDDFPLPPGQTVRVSIANGGRFDWRDHAVLLVCLHDAGQPMTVTVGPITMTGGEPPAVFTDTPEARRERIERLKHARTVQIDTDFPYYGDRSNESIASELRVNGFDGVYYYVIREDRVVPGLVGEMQRQHLAVALMTLPNLVYWSEAEMEARLPAGWRDWLIRFTGPQMDGYRFIGFVYPEYNAWYKEMLGRLLSNHRFDGFTFAEVMYPIYDGPEQEPPFYGDVSPGFRRAFREATGQAGFPDFTDPADPDYFRTNTRLYEQLVEYRVETINDFYDDIVNGPGGAREVCPDITFATWTLGINLPDGVDKLRTWEGDDIAAMIRRVRPDLHFIQTHAPDWSNPALPADYPLDYAPFFDAVRAADPDIAVGLQADFGSLPATRRAPEYLAEFYDAAGRAGVDTTTYYEFCIRYDVYASAPVLKEVRRKGGTLQLIFDQRLGGDSRTALAGAVLTDEAGRSYTVADARVDGNLLIVTPDRLPPDGVRLTVPVGGVADDPAVRLALSHLEPAPCGPVNRIPDGTTVTLEVLPEL